MSILCLSEIGEKPIRMPMNFFYFKKESARLVLMRNGEKISEALTRDEAKALLEQNINRLLIMSNQHSRLRNEIEA